VKISYGDATKAPIVSQGRVRSSVTVPTAGSTCVPTLAASLSNYRVEKPSPSREGGASGLSNLKRRLEEIETERKAYKMEKLALDDEVICLTTFVTKMSEEMMEIRKDLASLGTSLKQQVKGLCKLIIATMEHKPTVSSSSSIRTGVQFILLQRE
jgi:hypothetical protein